MSFEANIFVNQIQRIPFQKLQEFLKRYENDIKELSFEDQRAIMNFLDRRYAVLQRLQQADMEKELMFNVILFKQLGSSRYLPREARESAIRELRTLEVVPMIESLGYIDSKDVESVLSQYHSKISPDIIVTLLINLPENKQIKFKLSRRIIIIFPIFIIIFLHKIYVSPNKYIRTLFIWLFRIL